MPPSKKNKHNVNSDFLSNYLFLYNLIQLLGWSYITYQFIHYYATALYKHYKLWNYVFVPVAIFQTLAILEIIHVIFGFVKTSVMMTAMQILFRLLNTYGIFNLIPADIDTIGVPMTLLAWCGAEVTRYSYHLFKEINFVPHFITWIRYSIFIVLVPVGVSGELLGQYIIQSLYANRWTVLLPKINITVGYRHLIIAMMITSAQGVIMMYKHMFAQRKKALGISAPVKKKAK